MNKLEIIKRLSQFEDVHWVTEYGFNGLQVMNELKDASKDELIEWIKDAIKLFHDILNSGEVTLDDVAENMGYTDANHLERNVDNYGSPLTEWLNVVKELLGSDQRSNENNTGE